MEERPESEGQGQGICRQHQICSSLQQRACSIELSVTLYFEGLADVAAFNWLTSMVENP